MISVVHAHVVPNLDLLCCTAQLGDGSELLNPAVKRVVVDPATVDPALHAKVLRQQTSCALRTAEFVTCLLRTRCYNVSTEALCWPGRATPCLLPSRGLSAALGMTSLRPARQRTRCCSLQTALQ